jgi:hypothetical protein
MACVPCHDVVHGDVDVDMNRDRDVNVAYLRRDFLLRSMIQLDEFDRLGKKEGAMSYYIRL